MQLAERLTSMLETTNPISSIPVGACSFLETENVRRFDFRVC